MFDLIPSGVSGTWTEYNISFARFIQFKCKQRNTPDFQALISDQPSNEGQKAIGNAPGGASAWNIFRLVPGETRPAQENEKRMGDWFGTGTPRIATVTL